MKWMGGWSQYDLDEASPELINEIITVMNEEADRLNKD